MIRSEFCVPTKDGVAHLNGDFLEPADHGRLLGTVLIVPGGWFAERDGFMGDTYTEDDLMYRRLAHRICDAGYCVARFDNRGVSGNELSVGIQANSDTFEQDTDRYIKTCINSNIRRSVGPESQASDVATIVELLEHSFQVASERLVVFAHSEGGIHVARCLGKQLIAPRGILLAGTSMLSPMNIMKWQLVDRNVDELMSWDRNGDDRVSVSDVDSCFEGSLFAELGMASKDLFPSGLYWTRESSIDFFEQSYQSEKCRALQIVDEDYYPSMNSDESSFAIAKGVDRQLRDRTSVCRGLYRDHRIEIIGLERSAAAFAVAIHFGGDPDDGAGELPIV